MDSVINASKYENFELRDKDIIGITESLIARTQGNYANQEDIAKDVNDKFHKDIGIVFPILSRNRFSIILKGIAMTGKKIHLVLNYPTDEVGNQLMDIDKMYQLKINPYTDVLTEKNIENYLGKMCITHLLE